MRDDGYFDEAVAAGYDDFELGHVQSHKIDPVIDFLAPLAGTGRALELGVGTGRIALPLAQRGIPVSGIDISQAMVARLAAKPGGEDMEVTIGDFATTRVSGEFTPGLSGVQHDHEPDDTAGPRSSASATLPLTSSPGAAS